MGKPVPLEDLPPELAAPILDKRATARKAVEVHYGLPDGALEPLVKISDLSTDPTPFYDAAARDLKASAQPAVDPAAAAPVVPGTPVQIPTGKPPVAAPGPTYDPSTGGGTLQFGPFDTGVKTPQWLDRTLSGAGKAFADTGLGLRQLTGNATQAEVDEAARLGKPLMDTGAGQLGYAGGVLAQLAAPGGAAGAAAKGVAKVLPSLAKAPGVLKTLAASPYLQAGAAGGAYGGAQPVVTGDSRTANAVTSGALNAAGLGAVNGVKALVAPAAKAALPAVGALADKAMKNYGIDLTAAQVSQSKPLQFVSKMLNNLPFSGGATKAAEQEKQWVRQINKTMGEDTDDLGEALIGARKRIGGEYDQLSANHQARLDVPHLDALDDAIKNYAPYDMSTGQANVKALATIADKILDTADPQGQIPGSVYKTLRSRIGAMKTSTTDSNLRTALGDMQRALDDSMRSNMPADKQQAWRTLDKQWSNLRTLEKLAPKDANGTVDFRRLATVLNSTARSNAGNKAAMTYGTGDQTLPELAKIGTTFLADGSPASGNLAGQFKGFPRAALGAAQLGGAGAGAYHLMGNNGKDPEEESPLLDWTSMLALGSLGGIAGARGLNSNWFARGVPLMERGATMAGRLGAAQAPAAYTAAQAAGVVPTTPARED